MSGRVIIDCPGFTRYAIDCPGEDRRRARSPPRNQHPPRRDQLPYFAPSCGCTVKAGPKEVLSPFAKFEDLNPAIDDAPDSDLYYLVLSKVVSGFILGERRWGLRRGTSPGDQFRQGGVQVPLPMDRLARGDFVKNKGQGRTFLLHGSPGVGKTCTAECVAKMSRGFKNFLRRQKKKAEDELEDGDDGDEEEREPLKHNGHGSGTMSSRGFD
ncbi:hypothetical protein GGR54DRAFT_649669 [Hypoxylon sp. NC1633]|nr:hypothetical protein GGR54DRAFT_649669 [Hypoxylon sp. NC1633]